MIKVTPLSLALDRVVVEIVGENDETDIAGLGQGVEVATLSTTAGLGFMLSKLVLQGCWGLATHFLWYLKLHSGQTSGIDRPSHWIINSNDYPKEIYNILIPFNPFNIFTSGVIKLQ